MLMVTPKNLNGTECNETVIKMENSNENECNESVTKMPDANENECNEDVINDATFAVDLIRLTRVQPKFHETNERRCTKSSKATT